MPDLIPAPARDILRTAFDPRAMEAGLLYAMNYSTPQVAAAMGAYRDTARDCLDRHVAAYARGGYRARYAAAKALTLGVGALVDVEIRALLGASDPILAAAPYGDFRGGETLLDAAVAEAGEREAARRRTVAVVFTPTEARPLAA